MQNPKIQDSKIQSSLKCSQSLALSFLPTLQPPGLSYLSPLTGTSHQLSLSHQVKPTSPFSSPQLPTPWHVLDVSYLCTENKSSGIMLLLFSLFFSWKNVSAIFIFSFFRDEEKRNTKWKKRKDGHKLVYSIIKHMVLMLELNKVVHVQCPIQQMTNSLSELPPFSSMPHFTSLPAPQNPLKFTTIFHIYLHAHFLFPLTVILFLFLTIWWPLIQSTKSTQVLTVLESFLCPLQVNNTVHLLPLGSCLGIISPLLSSLLLFITPWPALKKPKGRKYVLMFLAFVLAQNLL